MDNSIRTGLPRPGSAGSSAPATGIPAIPARGRVAPQPGPAPGGARQRDQDAGQGAGAGAGRSPLLRGPADLLAESLGEAVLPPPLELDAALEAALRHADLADKAVPGLGRLVAAVIEDERFKLTRMLELGR